jgi:Xaa-Pro aminopeptidase
MDNSKQIGEVTVFAGVPAVNNALYHEIRFLVGDPAAFVHWSDGRRSLILRDIEMGRAREKARVDDVYCPADYAPAGGLSGDRETATAQALTEFLLRSQVQHVRSDRTLPLIFADHMARRGITVRYDEDLGVSARRRKDEQEIAWLRHAQEITERVMRRACETIARAEAKGTGILFHEGEELTSERMRFMIDVWLLEFGFQNHESILAGGPQAADCHCLGSGPLVTGQPVIVDIFPQDRQTRYHGDCTRTVVHGVMTPEVQRMHAAVVRAKQAATAACKAGVSGEAVHLATRTAIEASGYAMGLPKGSDPDSYCAMTHGTGHGIGLDIHEPPLLDRGGPDLVVGDVLTIEPGLYCKAIGGVRVEDMVVVRDGGCENFNRLPEGLEWR